MPLTRNTSQNETVLKSSKSRTLLKILEPDSPVHEQRTNMQQSNLKAQNFEICISPIEDGKKFETEVLEGPKKKKKGSPMRGRQPLNELNANENSETKKKLNSKITSQKSLLDSFTTNFLDAESGENRGTNEIPSNNENLKPAIILNDKKSRKKDKTSPSQKKSKIIESRISLFEMKRKSLKLTSPREKKIRHTHGNFTSASDRGETEKNLKIRETKSNKHPCDCKGIEKLRKIFPHVEPMFLKHQYSETKVNLDELIDWLKDKEKSGELPYSENYKKKLESEKIVKKLMQDFTVENFLKAIPDPWNYFLNTEVHNSVRYADHSFHYLKNKYRKHYSQTIQEILARCDYSLYKADKELSNKRKNRMLKMRASNRSKNECDTGKPENINFQFLQEVIFIENENKIIEEIKRIEAAKCKKLKKAKTAGSLLRCQSCFRNDLLWEDAVCCSNLHVFCGQCINRYIEREMREGNFNFKCLSACEEILPLESIQDVVNPDLMAVIVRRNQLRAMELAGIEDVEFCPFCYQAIDVSPEQSTVSCLNPCCAKEYCRNCKAVSHAPLECSQVENIKMSESMLETKIDSNFFTCLSCQQKFMAEDDSNKMICPCGNTICSICRQPSSNCSHFKSNVDEEENSITNDELSSKSSQEEPDSLKKENFKTSNFSPSEIFPDFVSSDSGTF